MQREQRTKPVDQTASVCLCVLSYGIKAVLSHRPSHNLLLQKWIELLCLPTCRRSCWCAAVEEKWLHNLFNLDITVCLCVRVCLSFVSTRVTSYKHFNWLTPRLKTNSLNKVKKKKNFWENLSFDRFHKELQVQPSSEPHLLWSNQLAVNLYEIVQQGQKETLKWFVQ